MSAKIDIFLGLLVVEVINEPVGFHDCVPLGVIFQLGVIALVDKKITVSNLRAEKWRQQ